jgi:hypothetical protein
MSSWADVHKGVGNGSELSGVLAACDDFAVNRNLMSCLTGYDRETEQALTPCKVSLFYELGHVKLCVNDTKKERVGFATLQPHPAGLLASIEEALASPLDWRKAKKGDTQGFRR